MKHSVNNFFTFAALAAVVVVAGCAHSGSNARVAETMVCEPDPAQITLLGLTLGESTLKDAREVIGPSTVTVGKYRHEPYVICYRSADASDTTTLTLQTDFFGDWERLTQFEISSSGPAGGCAESDLVNSGIAIKCGLKLGMSRSDVKAIMGEPGIVRGDVEKYMYIVEKKLTGEKRERMAEFGIVVVDYDVITTIMEMEFAKDRLVRIRVSWSESV